jgi:8-oxo-dGTP pyrophosphatase MutT (NUDIX family)
MSSRGAVIAAVHLLLIRNGQVLLARRYNTGYEDGQYSVVAGHVERGEPATAAMAREAREEAGIDIAPADLVLAHVMHRRTREDERVDFFFTARRWQGEPRIGEPDRCDDLRWFPLDALPPSVIPYVRTALAHHRERTVFSEHGWA